ncbi:hypothetical protein M514_00145 [Trichuris suis]|uniref:Calcineurin-like phosphoesterase domain-containing protein n=1 Tax=Trichuris suis TaxID=68888 RepID=A0A085NU68_9BILA|nr:hypothetical protein M513_00145 [Trichuris suis]KFD73014.1 hypothetical protein M514_00145 [Trichuris suis]
MAEYQQKVLVCGDVLGNFVNLWVRMEQVLRKITNFEMMLVCGEFFGSDMTENLRITKGELRCPLPTYILGPVKPDAARYYCNVAGGEIGHNLIYLGKKGMFTSASGLTVAYLSGFESEYEDEFHFSEDTVDRLIASITSRPNFSGIDILLTSQWPQGVEHLSPVAPDVYEEEDLRSSMLITKLAAALRPRYHFSANTGCHFERPPYRNSSLVARQPGNTTRFVGLSRCGNPSKLKYLFAFNIIPFKYLAPGQATEESAVTTEFPYTETLQELEIRKEQKKQKKPNENIRGRQFFFDFASVEASGAPDNEQGSRQVKVGALSQ